MSLLTLFATLTVIACASASKFCCTPERYSVNTAIKAFSTGGFFQGKGRRYYDSAARMYVTITNMTIDEEKGVYREFKTYFDVKSSTSHTVTGGRCTKEQVDLSWLPNMDNPHCIPDNAILDSNFAVGGPHEDVELNKYTISLQFGKLQMIVTKHNCFPVKDIYAFGKRTSNGFEMKNVTVIRMSNLKLYVDDPSVFVLPDICKKTPRSTKRINDINLPVDPWQFKVSIQVHVHDKDL